MATFTHANGVEPASAFTATINWGDGTTSTGTITLSGTTYTRRRARTATPKAGTPHDHDDGDRDRQPPPSCCSRKIGDEVPDLPDHSRGWRRRPAVYVEHPVQRPALRVDRCLSLLNAIDESTFHAVGSNGKVGDVSLPLLDFGPRRIVRQRRGDQPLTAVAPGPIQ